MLDKIIFDYHYATTGAGAYCIWAGRGVNPPAKNI
jgi:hypothetical protein